MASFSLQESDVASCKMDLPVVFQMTLLYIAFCQSSLDRVVKVSWFITDLIAQVDRVMMTYPPAGNVVVAPSARAMGKQHLRHLVTNPKLSPCMEHWCKCYVVVLVFVLNNCRSYTLLFMMFRRCKMRVKLLSIVELPPLVVYASIHQLARH